MVVLSKQQLDPCYFRKLFLDYMQDENFHPNRCRRNPFKSNERVSFPSFQDAISRSKDYHVRKFASPESVKSSPKWLNLTIGTQALIHPDSFAEDLCSSYSREESKSPGERNWEDLTSPELKTGIASNLLWSPDNIFNC